MTVINKLRDREIELNLKRSKEIQKEEQEEDRKQEALFNKFKKDATSKDAKTVKVPVMLLKSLVDDVNGDNWDDDGGYYLSDASLFAIDEIEKIINKK